jgi:hypothetical protein
LVFSYITLRVSTKGKGGLSPPFLLQTKSKQFTKP